MLEFLRRSVSGWTARILLGLLVISFAVWGIADVFRGQIASAVVRAGDTTVSLTDYAFAYQQIRNGIARQLQRLPTAEEAAMFGLDQIVLSQLVSDAVLDEQASEIGLGVSEDRLARLIAEDPSFQDASGNFSRAAFRDIVNSVGLSEQEFIVNREDAATRDQIVEAVAEGIVLPTAIRTAVGHYAGERRTVDYLVLSPDWVQPVPEPSQDALTAYFEANKADYGAPEYRSFAYAALTPEALADPTAVAEEDITADYERNRQAFTTPERRRIEQIVFPDRAAADAARAKLVAGATFESVVTESGRSLADTQLGLLAKADVPDPQLAEAAFALPLSQPSDVVEGSFGPAILRVTEIQPDQVRPLDEVREEIRQELALVAASENSTAAYDAFEDARAAGATVEEAAARAGLTSVVVQAIDANGLDPEGQPVPDLPAADQLIEAVFQTDPGLDNAPLNFGSNSYVFFEVRSVEPARERSFEEVRDRLVEDWKAAETQRLLAERVQSLAERLRNGESMDALAAELGLTRQTANAITRQSGTTEIGQAATSAAFSGGAGHIATASGPDGASQVLLQVAQVLPPADPLSNIQPQQEQQLTQNLSDDLRQVYVTRLQAAYPVSVFPDAIEQAKAMAR